GAMGSVTWTVSGTLPSGVSIDGSTGAISGTPSQWGSFTAFVQARDSWGTDRTDGGWINFTVEPSALIVDSSPLTNAIWGVAYSAPLSASGGTGSTIWTIASGKLPGGITLALNGTLSGAPTEIGPFPFTVRVQDANWQSHTTLASLSLAVDPPEFAVTG